LLVIAGTFHFTFNKLNHEALITQLKYAYDDAWAKPTSQNLLLGSSSIKRLNAKKFLQCGDWINRGIGAATIPMLINYLKYSPLSISPKHILFYAGENDIAKGNSVKQTFTNYKELLNIALRHFPSSEIHIIAIKPSPSRSKAWLSFEAVNEELWQFAQIRPKVHLHAPRWQSAKHLGSSAFLSDGVHLSETGYKIFTREVNQTCHQ